MKKEILIGVAAFSLFMTGLYFLIKSGYEQRAERARDCLHSSGKWVQVSRDYFTCVYAEDAK
jgi:hypothetical protein